MMNLYGGTGMGSAGTGVNTGGSMGLQQLMAMLSAGQGGQASGPGMTTPMAPGGVSTPMSNYIGAPQGMAGGMQHPAMPPVAAPVTPGQSAPGQPATSGQNPMQMMQMLAAMKQGQGGLSPQGQLPAGQDPNSLSWLQRLFGGGMTPGAVGTGAGAGGMT